MFQRSSALPWLGSALLLFAAGDALAQPVVEAPAAGAPTQAPDAGAPAEAPAEEAMPAELPAPADAAPSAAVDVAETPAVEPEAEESAEEVPDESADAAEEGEAPASEAPASDPHARHGGSPGIELPAEFRLHGRFDLVFEHDGYQDQPFQSGNEHIRNYHHFVFLSRSAPDDPFGIDVELVDLTFYEISFTHRPEDEPWHFTARGGKMFVPFGPEPLFHTAYGGRVGFDQKLMPALWSRLGARVGFVYDVRALGIQVRDDLYGVQGYRLPAQDAVLNLQADLDDTGFGFGNRLGLGWGPITAWYSVYANALGFGRNLFMQALDVEVYRWPDVTLLDHFAVGLGAMRADVTGGDDGYGGAGEDYYHFATYFQVRAFPLDWLQLQYRQGLTTYDNRRGVFRDTTRLDERDNATHNLAVVARYRGFSVALSHGWNLEQKNEVDDDYLRLMVAYDF